jgi:hypothetical protein
VGPGVAGAGLDAAVGAGLGCAVIAAVVGRGGKEGCNGDAVIARTGVSTLMGVSLLLFSVFCAAIACA